MEVNYNARELVDRAKKAGLSTKQIADLCGVGESTVRRWRQLGKADGEAIKPLTSFVGPSNSPEDLADVLVRLYKKHNAFRLSIEELKTLAGRGFLSDRFLSNLHGYLEDLGYCLHRVFGPDFEGDDEVQTLVEKEFYILVSTRKLKRIVARHLPSDVYSVEE